MKIKDFLKKDKETTLISLSYLLDTNRNYLMLNQDLELSIDISTKLSDIIKKINQGYPLQYAIGIWNFYGLDFITDQRALIPRYETEILVDKIINSDIKKNNILDIGTGTGAIAISLSHYLRNSKVTGIDISEKAIELALENKRKLNAKNVEFFVSDLFTNVNEKYDIIVSNPPYINQNDYNNLDSILYYEPQNALLGGEDGLFFYRKIISQAKKYLINEGYLFLEIGYDQRRNIEKLMLEHSYKNIKSFKDYNNFDRIVLAQA